MKKFGKILGGIILGIVLILLVAVAILTALEYRPDQIETLNTTSGKQSISTGDSMTILTYNTGYAGLSKDEDFFMDGGSKVMPETKDLVKHNMKGIAGILNDADADVCFLQEVDIDSKRSYHINEKAYYEKALGVDGIFACNFKCVYVPYPLPTIGKVESGLVTYSDYKVSEASRIALPESFKWPVKTCNLKRCMLETRIPIKGSDKELVLINFHLEAYDSGEGKIAQRKVLVKKLKEEYEKRNSKLANKDKIFSVSHLNIMLEKEREKYLNQIKECNLQMQPKEFVVTKQKLESQKEFYEEIDIKESEKTNEEKQIEELQKYFLKCLEEKIDKAEGKKEITDLIYEIRYYEQLPYKQYNISKESKIEEYVTKVEKQIIKKACVEKVLIRFTQEEELNYKILKNQFQSKIIKLENTIYVLKYKKGILKIEIYDTNIEEETKEIEISEKVELNVKLNKKIKIWE